MWLIQRYRILEHRNAYKEAYSCALANGGMNVNRSLQNRCIVCTVPLCFRFLKVRAASYRQYAVRSCKRKIRPKALPGNGDYCMLELGARNVD
jgi:hypothetical protein